MAQTIPDTDAFGVACLAAAFEIVMRSYVGTELREEDASANARKFAQEIRRIQQHLYSGDPIPDAGTP